MRNTQNATIGGLDEWSRHGAYCVTTSAEPDKVLVDEDWKLSSLYEGAHEASTLSDNIAKRMRF